MSRSVGVTPEGKLNSWSKFSDPGGRGGQDKRTCEGNVTLFNFCTSLGRLGPVLLLLLWPLLLWPLLLWPLLWPLFSLWVRVRVRVRVRV